MTIKEAILTLNANVVIACERAGFSSATVKMIEDALDTIWDALKAQEPVEPVFDAGDGKTIGQFLCGKCHAKIGFGHPHFCWYCGRAVKWE